MRRSETRTVAAPVAERERRPKPAAGSSAKPRPEKARPQPEPKKQVFQTAMAAAFDRLRQQ
jgi:hypothetical protein